MGGSRLPAGYAGAALPQDFVLEATFETLA